MITVKETIIAAAQLLGIADEVNDYLESVDDTGRVETKKLLQCFNLVENELALDYLPLQVETELETTTGAIYYNELPKNVVRILKVKDEWDNSVPFKLFPEYLKTQSGKVRILYSYTPDNKELEDCSDFTLYASVRLFAYGMAMQYSLAGGLFEEANVWQQKYKNALSKAYRSAPSKNIRSRRWV